MININRALLSCLMVLLVMGCELMPRQQRQTRYQNPVLPMSMTCDQLVDHLNHQTRGLTAWKSVDTTVSVRMPNGMPHKLSGNIACQAPDHFRLSASSIVAHADLGSNSERCWFYVQPGDGQVLTWRHEDAAMLQHFAVGIPQIDPAWLMAVLGVVPLDPADFDLSNGPAGAPELWLTSISDDFQGRPLRRVIKVDTVSGLVREHVVYNHDRQPLIRATLRDHKSCQGHLIPQIVTLEFPELDTELTLRFHKIETNCQLADSLWVVPEKRHVRVTDLGDMMRGQTRMPEVSLPRQITATTEMVTNGVSAPGVHNAAVSGFDAEPLHESRNSGAAVSGDPPEWDQPPVPASFERPAGQTTSERPRERRGLMRWFGR